MSRTLYVHRPLLNTEDLIDWAVRQGFSKTLDPDDMHVTVAFSKKPVHWHHLTPHSNQLHIVGDQRAVVPLGEKGATVLQFFHPHLHQRWKEFLSHGASWDHDGFRPHVTLTYEPHGLDLRHIQAYRGPLILGPEKFAPVVLDWDKRIQELPLVGENRAVLAGESDRAVKYSKSIMENNSMADNLASILMKNIDLILEAYNVDEKGNLIEVNKKKVRESDDVFHQYFVKSMNRMFRQINENDPIMNPNMGGGYGGMHQGHGMGGGDDLGLGGDELGFGGNEHLGGHPGHMGGHPGQMGHPGHMGGGQQGHLGGIDDGGYGGVDDQTLGDMMDDDMQAGGMVGAAQGGMGGGMAQGGMGGGGMGGGGPAMESTEFDWVLGEEADLDVNSLFDDLSEDDEDDGDQLNEFGMHGMHDDEMMDDGMGGGGMGGGMGDMGGGMGGGHNDFGGDMDGGMSGGGMGGGMGHHMGDDGMGGGMGGDEGMGGGDDMVTIHGQTDGGGEFEFSFDPETLGFGGGDSGDMGGDMGDMGGDMGGGDDEGMGDDDFGGHESHGGGGSHEGEHGEEEEENPVAEAAGRKPGKGKRGARTSRMGIVPADPETSHAAPFPTPQGTRQKRK